jgi:hypothetical protein
MHTSDSFQSARQLSNILRPGVCGTALQWVDFFFIQLAFTAIGGNSDCLYPDRDFGYISIDNFWQEFGSNAFLTGRQDFLRR